MTQELKENKSSQEAIDEQIKQAVDRALKERELQEKRLAAIEKSKKESSKKGIYVIYTGTYFHKENGNTSSRNYEIEIQLIDDPYYRMPREDKILQIGRFKLLPNYFLGEGRENFSCYTGLREVKILNIKTYGTQQETNNQKKEDEEKPISKMTIKQLVKFSVKKDLVTNPNKFSTVGAARAAVEEEWENRKIAEQEQYGADEKEQAKKSSEFADVKELLEFNNVKI